MVKRILAANDGSEGSKRAFTAALTLARQLKAELHMVCVEELPYFPTSVDEVIEDKLDANHRFEPVVAEARAQAKAHHLKLTVHILAGHPVPRITETVAQEAIDLLVIGYMGHTALYNRLIGGTTDRLVELAPCSVLVVK
jgi:nucleotide-binding universal stress UspA family protein